MVLWKSKSTNFKIIDWSVISIPASKSQKAQKSNGKVRKKWIKVNISCKNIQKARKLAYVQEPGKTIDIQTWIEKGSHSGNYLRLHRPVFNS